MPTTTVTPEEKLARGVVARRQEELLALETILEGWAGGQEPTEAQLGFAIGLIGEEHLGTERRRVSQRLSCLKTAGTKEEFATAKEAAKAAATKTEELVPDLLEKRDAVDREIQGLRNAQSRWEARVAEMAEAREQLPKLSASFMRDNASPWGVRNTLLNRKYRDPITKIETRLAVIKGVGSLYAQDDGARLHVESVAKGAGHPQLPEIQTDTEPGQKGWQRSRIDEQQWETYREALREEGEELAEELAALRSTLAAEEQLNDEKYLLTC